MTSATASVTLACPATAVRLSGSWSSSRYTVYLTVLMSAWRMLSSVAADDPRQQRDRAVLERRSVNVDCLSHCIALLLRRCGSLVRWLRRVEVLPATRRCKPSGPPAVRYGPSTAGPARVAQRKDLAANVFGAKVSFMVCSVFAFQSSVQKLRTGN